MGQKSGPVKEPAEQLVKEIRRATRRQFSAEEKIRIVLTGLRGEDSIAELCRREGIVQNLYYRWSKEFLEAGKKRLAGDTARAATSDEVKDLRREASALKEVVAELMLDNRLLKKSTIGLGKTAHEIHRRQEAGDHPAGRAVRAAGAPYPGETRYSPRDLLPLVRPAQSWRAGGLDLIE
jgi:transposase